jgi:hypothetical protein
MKYETCSARCIAVVNHALLLSRGDAAREGATQHKPTFWLESSKRKTKAKYET